MSETKVSVEATITLSIKIGTGPPLRIKLEREEAVRLFNGLHAALGFYHSHLPYPAPSWGPLWRTWSAGREETPGGRITFSASTEDAL